VQNDFYELYPELVEFREKIELLSESPKPSPLTPLLSVGEGKARNEQGEFGLLSLLQKERVGVRYTKKFLLIQG
jgi:hypothetical protein